MNFEEYLTTKKIDSKAFNQAEPSVWEAWKKEFEQMSPASFTSRKLYQINPIRRRFTLKAIAVKPVASPTPKPKPVIRPKLN